MAPRANPPSTGRAKRAPFSLPRRQTRDGANSCFGQAASAFAQAQFRSGRAKRAARMSEHWAKADAAPQQVSLRRSVQSSHGFVFSLAAFCLNHFERTPHMGVKSLHGSRNYPRGAPRHPWHPTRSYGENRFIQGEATMSDKLLDITGLSAGTEDKPILRAST